MGWQDVGWDGGQGQGNVVGIFSYHLLSHLLLFSPILNENIINKDNYIHIVIFEFNQWLNILLYTHTIDKTSTLIIYLKERQCGNHKSPRKSWFVFGECRVVQQCFP